MPEVRYISDCGCILKKDQLMRKKNSYGSVYCCRYHRGQITKRQIKCEYCGVWFDNLNKGSYPELCPDHNETRKYWVNRFNRDKWYRKKLKSEKKQSKARVIKKKPIAKKKRFKKMTRGDYCISLEACKRGGDFDCESCRVMLPVFPGVDPHRMIGAG